MASPRARALRNNPTEAETRLWRALRRRQIGDARFRRQVPIGPYVADFSCLSARLIVELDGSQHAERAPGDVRRDAWFTARGYRTLRFWNNQVFENLDGVIKTIAAALESPPHPDPPPPGGRENKISRS
jgi:very-short-patch-repair endonuclease